MKENCTEGAASETPINVREFLNRVGGEESFLSELLELYMLEFQAKYPELLTAFASRNLKRVEEVSHSLKGASASLSLPYLQKTFKEIEMGARSGSMKRIGPALSRVAEDFAALKKYAAQNRLVGSFSAAYRESE